MSTKQKWRGRDYLLIGCMFWGLYYFGLFQMVLQEKGIYPPKFVHYGFLGITLLAWGVFGYQYWQWRKRKRLRVWIDPVYMSPKPMYYNEECN